MLCSLLGMTEVIMLEITSSLQKSSRKLKRSMAVLAHVAVLRETSYETSSGGRRPRVLERLSALKLHTDSFFCFFFLVVFCSVEFIFNMFSSFMFI